MAFKAKLDMLTVGNKKYKSNPSIRTVHIHKLGHCKVCSSSVFHILPPASSHMREHCTPTVNSQPIRVLFADDTSITTYHSASIFQGLRENNLYPALHSPITKQNIVFASIWFLQIMQYFLLWIQSSKHRILFFKVAASTVIYTKLSIVLTTKFY
jgi:hypothetical protein